MTTGGGYVWVANRGDDTVWRIDPRTNVVISVAAHGVPAAVAVSGQSAAIVDGPGTDSLVTVDATTGSVTSVEALPGDGGAVPVVAGGSDGLWLADPEQRSLTRSDLAGRFSGSATVTPIPVGKGGMISSRYVSFDGIAVGVRSVWIVGDPLGRTVWRISRTTNRLDATIELPFAPAGIAVGANAVWVTSLLNDTVSRIDPASNRIVARVAVGRGAGAVSADARAVWVANAIDHTVSKIDAKTNVVLATIHVGVTPVSIAIDASGVWVVGKLR